MDSSTFLAHIQSDGEALAAAAKSAPTGAIPTCPDWDMTALVGHMGGVHHWVDEIVSTRSPSYIKRPSARPDGFDATLAWYEQGLTDLLATLRQADPDEAVWNWSNRAAAPARFWFRRMAHETSVHRWDAEAGAGETHPIEANLAIDGIEEYLGFVGQWLGREPVADLTGSLHLHATDADGEWSLDLAPDRLEYRREHAKSDVAMRGPVSDLLLWMVNRIPPDSPTLTVFGDATILDRWRQLTF